MSSHAHCASCENLAFVASGPRLSFASKAPKKRASACKAALIMNVSDFATSSHSILAAALRLWHDFILYSEWNSCLPASLALSLLVKTIPANRAAPTPGTLGSAAGPAAPACVIEDVLALTVVGTTAATERIRRHSPLEYSGAE